MASPIELAGTKLEGGGQLVRIAVGISALTGIPISIRDIRGNRSGGGGLKTQHLTAVNWLATASSAETVGAEKKSRTLEFTPDQDRIPGDGSMPKDIDIGSPGSIGLVFQAILPFIMFSAPASDSGSIQISIRGGTNVSFSPSFEYIEQVLLPTLALIGLPPITATLKTRGWSTGGQKIGRATFNITPLSPGARLPPFNLQNRGNITNISATLIAEPCCYTLACSVLNKVLAAKMPASTINKDINDLVTVHLEPSNHPKRLYLLLVAKSSTGHKLGRDWLYDEKIRDLPTAVTRLVERVVGELAREVEHGGCVDEYMRDQLVVFQALADGRSEVDVGMEKSGEERKAVEPSLHTRTAEWVVRELLGEEVEFDGRGGCKGVGKVKKDQDEEEVVNGIERLHVDAE
ncbi:RNA 3'-terminal phosphate cyclase [Saccharata proteae CBS 121410]|uniref:RNA 3'-terminal phosphate cyclase n=1 Tax=Saccharata proteae CBS 121410 TaxID=1314787 RepID=A0A9P4HT98_9PEZI|nr:RNA 3'-terminal phosphate cyclase [Saccharata proteae CBS 121410]